MNKAVRILLVFFSFVASYYFIFWVPFSLIPGVHNIPAIPVAVSFILATGTGILVWKKTRVISGSFGKYILMGGIVVGSISFLMGFIGPIIFNPTANQGPLLGIFITGPVGFLIGLAAGGLYWRVKIKK